MYIDYKADVKQREIENILAAQAFAAMDGDAVAVIRLSKLLHKRLNQMKGFKQETEVSYEQHDIRQTSQASP